jgi:hypothetical protein
MGHASPVYFSYLVNGLRRNETGRGLDKILRKRRISGCNRNWGALHPAVPYLSLFTLSGAL